MQYRPGLLVGFLASTGLEFKPFLQLPPLAIVSAAQLHSFVPCGYQREYLTITQRWASESPRTRTFVGHLCGSPPGRLSSTCRGRGPTVSIRATHLHWRSDK